ncbi:hypothetical protein KA013_00565 [Patescibacteria group bacterium]|nr:hypothetical protein [Patescibacteria group bacterium]
MNIEPESFGVDPKHPITKPDLTWIPPVEFSSFLKYIPGATPEMVNLAYTTDLIHELFFSARVPWNPSIEKEIG